MWVNGLYIKYSPIRKNKICNKPSPLNPVNKFCMKKMVNIDPNSRNSFKTMKLRIYTTKVYFLLNFTNFIFIKYMLKPKIFKIH